MRLRKLSKWIKLLFLGISIITGRIWLPPVSCHATTQHLSQETPQPVISEILIEIDSPYGELQRWQNMARALLRLQVGEQFSEARLQESINALKQSRRFQSIEVDSKTEAQVFSLLFRLTPYQRIKDIRIKGAYPLFERDVLNALTIGTGDPFSEETVANQSQLISERFRREGFIDPEVKTTVQTDPHDGNIILHVDIKPGSYQTLEWLDITVNGKPPIENIKSRMKTWRQMLLPGMAGRYMASRLKKDIDALTRHYRKKGYPEVVIHSSVEKGASPGRISVSLSIDTGPEYDIRFTGNEKLRESVLRNDLVLFDEGNPNDIGLKKSIRKIKNRYREAGYLKIKITMRDEITEIDHRPVRRIALLIDEGPCSTVSMLKIEGNTHFSDQEIKNETLTGAAKILGKAPFVPERFDDDLNAVKLFYLRHGYMNTKISESIEWGPDNETVFIQIRIEEGIQTKISDIRIEGIQSIPEQEAYQVLQMKTGQPFRSYMLKSDQNRLSALIAEKGYPHVRISHRTSFNEDRSQVQITYAVDEGPLVKFGEFFITGNFRTRDSVIQNELAIATDTPFSLKAMLESQRRLRDLAIFDSVKIIPLGLKEKSETVNLIVEIEEKKPYFVEIGIGYENYKGFFGNAKAGDRNLFGTNKDAWLGADIAQIGYRTELGIEDRRLLGTRTIAALNLFAEQREEFNQNFGTKSYGSSLGLIWKQFGHEHLSAGLRLQFEQRDTFTRGSSNSSTEADDETGIEVGTRSILVTSPSIQYDSRDSFIRPREGLFSSLALDVSQRLDDSTDDFLKYRLDNRFFWTPLNRLTFACLIRGGYIDAFGSNKSIPEDQLFYLGGTSSVRGFDENLLRFDTDGDPLGGRATLSGSLETRIDLGHNFELTLFYDAGSLGDSFEDIYSGDLRSSCGAGLRYITPVGPIGILYGYKLDRKEDESPGKFHFSLGYTF